MREVFHYILGIYWFNFFEQGTQLQVSVSGCNQDSFWLSEPCPVKQRGLKEAKIRLKCSEICINCLPTKLSVTRSYVFVQQRILLEYQMVCGLFIIKKIDDLYVWEKVE